MAATDGDVSKTQTGAASSGLGVFSIANQLRYGLLPVISLTLLITAGLLIYLTTGWNAVVELPAEEAFAPIQNRIVVMGSALAVATLVMLGLGVFLTRKIAIPLERLTEAATQISSGNMEAQIRVTDSNEMGLLALTLNQMTNQLRERDATLEQRVVDRTRRLEIAASLGQQLSAILDSEALLAEAVNQIKDNFGYYHVQIYLIEDEPQKLVLAAATGQAGAEMQTRGHNIPLDSPTSLAARAARTGGIVNVDNVRTVEGWRPNPMLPDSYAEMAVPIRLTTDEQVIGVLDVQANRMAGLDEEDARLLRSLAAQTAVAIRNARRFGQVEETLAEIHAAQARYLEKAWRTSEIVTRSGSHHFARPDVPDLDQRLLAAAKQQALAQAQPAIVTIDSHNTKAASGQNQTQESPDPNSQIDSADNPPARIIVAPITFRDETIGTLQLHPAENGQSWTEDDLVVVAAVVDQLAQSAESLRLFEETRERASRERLVGQINEKMRRAPDMERLMQVAVTELAHILGPDRVFVRLGSEAELVGLREADPGNGRPAPPKEAAQPEADLKTPPNPSSTQPGDEKLNVHIGKQTGQRRRD